MTEKEQTRFSQERTALVQMLQTERLTLHPFGSDEKELAAICRIFGDKEVNRFLPWFPIKDQTAARQFYEERMAPVYESGLGAYYAVCLQEAPTEPIGYVTVSESENHDLGYGLLPQWQRRGLITEAVRGVVAAMAAGNWQYVTATHDVNNPASGRVMEKAGLTYRYSYNEQWQPKNKRVTFRLYQKNFDGRDWTYKGYWDRYPEHFVEGV